MSTKYKLIMLLAREHGLSVLKELVNHPIYEVSAVFTHKLNPKSQDPERKERKYFQEFVHETTKKSIQLYTIDEKEENTKLYELAENTDFDFLLSVSWRYVLSPASARRSCNRCNMTRRNIQGYRHSA